jgi:hypothetical protein
VRRHTEGDDLVIGAVPVELWHSVATMAVYNKKPIDSSCASSCMLVKVLHPLEA